MTPFKGITREEFYLYSYKLFSALLGAKLRGNEQKTFRELVEDIGIRDAGDMYPARLSFLLEENRKRGRIQLTQIPLKPFLKYSISQQGEEYFILSNGFIAYLMGMYNVDSATDEIIVKASRLADNFINFPKKDLEEYR